MSHRMLSSALIALICLGFRFSLSADEPRMNVIFILVDDWGWTDGGTFGSDLYETPNIDRLAREGMRFTDAYSACTVCSPTRASAMTGKYPARLHVTDWIKGHRRPYAKLAVPDWTMYLDHDEVTIAEALKPAGYATCSIGKWHLGNEGHWPLLHGFDENHGGYHRGQPPSYFAPYKIPTLKEGPDGEYLTDREAAEAVGFIERHRAEPFFIYLPHYAVHTPIQGKADVTARYKAKITESSRHRNAMYAAMVESVDDATGRIMKKLEELEIADRTVIILTGDNGGLMRITHNHPLRAGKGSSYEGGVRVPLIIKWPGVTKPGSVCAEPVATPDYYPTILEITGVGGDATHNAAVDGRSLVPVLRDARARLARDALYWHYPHYHPGGATPYGAIRDRGWKLIEFYEDMHVELYNLAEDIGEAKDLAAANPDFAADLRRRLHAWRDRVDAQMPTPNPQFDPDRKKQRRRGRQAQPRKNAK